MNRRLSRRTVAMILMAVLLVGTMITTSCGSNDLQATTMRMLRRQGVVKLFDKDNKEKTITDNLKLTAGNILNTEAQSLAGIALDDTKIVTIDESSRAQFDQDGKKLDINLTEGSLFFEVTKKLDDDESFDIRTSTMVVGIRGTSGLVKANVDGRDEVLITDGEVEVVGTNQVTGESKTITVKAGEKAVANLYNDRTVDSIEFEVQQVKEEDLTPFVVDRLVENESLIQTVCDDTGWSQEKIENLGNGSSETTDTESEDQSAEAASTEETTEETADASAEGESTETELTDAAGTEASEEEEPVSEVASAEDTSETAQSTTGLKNLVADISETGVMTLSDGSTFDPVYYASQYSDVAEQLGNDPYKLLQHYLTYGKNENRYATQTEQQTSADQGADDYEAFQKAMEQAAADEAARKAEEDRITYETQEAARKAKAEADNEYEGPEHW